MDIVEFLTARLDEDEAAAKAATPGPWETDDPMLSDFVGSRAIMKHIADCSVGTGYREGSIPDATHIARHDPARVLREVEAKRKLLQWCAKVSSSDWSAYNEDRPLPEQIQDLATNAAIDMALRAMTAPYADHPDYDPAWAPK